MSLTQIKEPSIYAVPEADLGNFEQQDSVDTKAFYIVSRSKLIVLSVCTLNLYLVYWFYRNWKLQKNNGDFPCLPILRAIFSIFFTHSLFSQVNDALQLKKIERHASGRMATLYVISLIAFSLINNWQPSVEQLAVFVMAFLATIGLQLLPIWYLQDPINRVCDDPNGSQNSSFSLLNWVFILLGSLYWGIMLFASFVHFI